MNIFDYLRKILPNFERHQVMEALEETRTQIDETLLDLLNHTAAIHKPKNSKEFRAASAAFYRTFPKLKSKPYFIAVQYVFNNISANLGYLSTQISHLFSRKITKESLTYRKTTILQLVDLASFSSEYAMRQLNYLLEAETSGKIKDRFIAPQIDYLVNNEQLWLDALSRLGIEKREFMKLIDEIPDIGADEESSAVAQNTLGFKKLDPFKMGFINQRFNPIYHLRLYRAEISVRRHQERKAEKQMLELRLLGMKEVQEGRQDPKMEEQINYLAGRIQTLEYEIDKFEKQNQD